MLPFREITLEDKAAVEKCGSHYNYHLCERCFVDLFIFFIVPPATTHSFRYKKFRCD